MKNVVAPTAVIVILAIGMIAYANTQETEPANDNPLQGKVVIINPSSISTPRENARIENLAGRNYVVYEVKPEEGNAYDSWIAVDEVSYLRVFKNMNDARAYQERKKTR